MREGVHSAKRPLAQQFIAAFSGRRPYSIGIHSDALAAGPTAQQFIAASGLWKGSDVVALEVSLVDAEEANVKHRKPVGAWFVLVTLFGVSGFLLSLNSRQEKETVTIQGNIAINLGGFLSEAAGRRASLLRLAEALKHYPKASFIEIYYSRTLLDQLNLDDIPDRCRLVYFRKSSSLNVFVGDDWYGCNLANKQEIMAAAHSRQTLDEYIAKRLPFDTRVPTP